MVLEKNSLRSSTAIYFDTGRLVTVDLPFGIYDAAYTNNGKRVSGLKTVKVLGMLTGLAISQYRWMKLRSSIVKEKNTLGIC